MNCNCKIIGLIAGALGLGILLATICPPWLLVWIMAVAIIFIGAICAR